MHLVQCPPDALDKVWPLAGSMIARAVEYTDGATSLDQQRAAILKGDKQLWLVIDNENKEIRNKVVAAGITSLQLNADETKTANIELFGGENMNDWFDQKDSFEKWAKTEGCHDIRLWARKGWAKRLDDFKLTHYIMRKVIA